MAAQMAVASNVRFIATPPGMQPRDVATFLRCHRGITRLCGGLWRSFAPVGGSIDKLTIADSRIRSCGPQQQTPCRKNCAGAAQLGEDSPGERVTASVSVCAECAQGTRLSVRCIAASASGALHSLPVTRRVYSWRVFVVSASL